MPEFSRFNARMASADAFDGNVCHRRFEVVVVTLIPVEVADATTREMYEDPMKLSECPMRTRLRLTSINLPAKNLLRMHELGLRPGSEAVVTQHAGFGGLVLNIAGSRVAVDHRSAKLIEAEVFGAGSVGNIGTEVTA